jgi:hypothetical protein
LTARGGYRRNVRVKILRYEKRGLVVKPLRGRPFTITYGEILTAERLRSRRGVRLHTRTTDPVRVNVRGSAVLETEAMLRGSGVRVVDCWGCLLTPTLADFEEALEQEPLAVRQSYDSA